MLQSSSFDYVGEPYHPRPSRPPPKPDNVKKRSATFSEVAGSRVPIKDRKWGQDGVFHLSDVHQESIKMSGASYDNDSDDDEDEDEVLQVPVTYG